MFRLCTHITILISPKKIALCNFFFGNFANTFLCLLLILPWWIWLLKLFGGMATTHNNNSINSSQHCQCQMCVCVCESPIDAMRDNERRTQEDLLWMPNIVHPFMHLSHSVKLFLNFHDLYFYLFIFIRSPSHSLVGCRCCASSQRETIISFAQFYPFMLNAFSCPQTHIVHTPHSGFSLTLKESHINENFS
jgi:hypothetical protein